MAQLNIRVDDSIKEQAEALFNRMGLTMLHLMCLTVRRSLNGVYLTGQSSRI